MDLKNIGFFALAVMLTIAYFYSFVIPKYEQEAEDKVRLELKETVTKIEDKKQDKANNQQVILNQSTETKKESKRLIDALPPVTPPDYKMDATTEQQVKYILDYKPRE